MIRQGDSIAVLMRESGVFKSTGQAYSIRAVQWFTFAGKKIKKIDEIVASIWKGCGVTRRATNQRSGQIRRSHKPRDIMQANMDTILIVLILLILLGGGGGFYYGGPAIGGGVAGLLLVVLIVWLIAGRRR